MLCAQHGLDRDELVGLIAHPGAIATFDRVLAGAQHHGVGHPWLGGRMPFELLLDGLQPVIELLRFGVKLDEFGHQRRQGFVA